jgi:hypothetical protein
MGFTTAGKSKNLAAVEFMLDRAGAFHVEIGFSGIDGFWLCAHGNTFLGDEKRRTLIGYMIPSEGASDKCTVNIRSWLGSEMRRLTACPSAGASAPQKLSKCQ